jgi:chromosome condensin MukBEF MukE localization factor
MKGTTPLMEATIQGWLTASTTIVRLNNNQACAKVVDNVNRACRVASIEQHIGDDDMDTNEYINDFREQIADLIEAQKTSLGYVVKCGPLWIKFTTGFDNTGTPTYTNPVACGALQATVFRTPHDAYHFGKNVRNGGGARGKAQSRSDAMQDSIDSLTSSIAFLEQNVVKA